MSYSITLKDNFSDVSREVSKVLFDIHCRSVHFCYSFEDEKVNYFYKKNKNHRYIPYLVDNSSALTDTTKLKVLAIATGCCSVNESLYLSQYGVCGITVLNGATRKTIKPRENVSRVIYNNYGIEHFVLHDVLEHNGVTWFLVVDKSNTNTVLFNDEGHVILIKITGTRECDKIVEIDGIIYVYCDIGSHYYLVDGETLEEYRIPDKVIINNKEISRAGSKITEGIPLTKFSMHSTIYYVHLKQLLNLDINDVPTVDPFLTVDYQCKNSPELTMVTDKSLFFKAIERCPKSDNSIATLREIGYRSRAKSARSFNSSFSGKPNSSLGNGFSNQ